MSYVDYTYYKDSYLLGKPPAVPCEDFEYWEKQARMEVDARTFDRIKKDESLATENVKDCVCAITELLFKADKVSEASLQEGSAGLLASYSNDGESGTFDLKESVYTESGKKTEIRRLISRYLGRTGLLYAGAACLES